MCVSMFELSSRGCAKAKDGRAEQQGSRCGRLEGCGDDLRGELEALAGLAARCGHSYISGWLPSRPRSSSGRLGTTFPISTARATPAARSRRCECDAVHSWSETRERRREQSKSERGRTEAAKDTQLVLRGRLIEFVS
jgi:hypothetical protein